ncbi:MAG TPA: secretin N-terminal domain-containing protein, partial [Pyrinomonadaceae bacterium]|nr:secretin N-terminal domain-containing protein [Pyrinomonadaceae bacterium]
MNSLTNLHKAAKKAVIVLAIVSSFAVAVVAQRIEPQMQGKFYGDPGFRGEPIDLNVVNADVRDILSYITDQYGVNFVIDKSVGSTPVTVKVTNVPWNVALDSVLQAQALGVKVNGNILRVADIKILAGEGELVREQQNNQLDTTPLYTELIRLNYATGGAGASTASPSAGTTSSSSSGPSAGGGGASSGADGLLPIIKRRLSRRGSIEMDSRSNSLIITDVAANLAAIKQLVAILDQPEPQVEIEARIVVGSRNFSRDIGVQLGAFLNGANGSGLGGGTLPNNKILLAPAPGVPNPSINNNLFSQLANTAIGLTTGVFGTAQINAMISAGEQTGQAKVIATPRVTALNNRQAEIKSGTKIPITTIQPGSAAGGAV